MKNTSNIRFILGGRERKVMFMSRAGESKGITKSFFFLNFVCLFYYENISSPIKVCDVPLFYLVK